MMQINKAHIAGIAEQLRDMLGDDYDTVTFLDTLDGETDALDIADRLLTDMREAEALAAATKAIADDYAARAKRIGARPTAIKGTLLTLLDAIGEKKLERPAGTISRRAGSVSVQITNADDVPRQLCRVTYLPDKAAIKAQLEAGETVPGAELVRGDDTVTVRAR
jgi:hypothetical protein